MTELFQKINWVDLLIVILLIRSSYVGFTRGFSWEFFRFAWLAGTVLTTVYFYEYTSQLIGDYFPVVSPFSNLLSFTSLYLIILLLGKLFAILLEKLVKFEVFSALEKIGGLLLGFTYGGILMSLLLISLILAPIPYFEKSVKERSYAAPTVLRVAPFLYDKTAVIFPALKLDRRNDALFKLTSPQERPSVFENTKAKILKRR